MTDDLTEVVTKRDALFYVTGLIQGMLIGAALGLFLGALA